MSSHPRAIVTSGQDYVRVVRSGREVAVLTSIGDILERADDVGLKALPPDEQPLARGRCCSHLLEAVQDLLVGRNRHGRRSQAWWSTYH